MTTLKKTALAVGVALLISVAGAVNAQAAQPDSMDRGTLVMSSELREYLDTLDPAAKAEVIRTQLPATTELIQEAAKPLDVEAIPDGTPVDMRSGFTSASCWTQRWNYENKALAGNVIFTSYHVLGWCESGNSVTSAWEAGSGGQPRTIGWRYEGVTNRASGVVSGQARSYSQHHFVYAPAGVDLQHSTPCARVAGFWTGTSLADRVCGIY